MCRNVDLLFVQEAQTLTLDLDVRAFFGLGEFGERHSEMRVLSSQ